jgi:hypothetical protein
MGLLSLYFVGSEVLTVEAKKSTVFCAEHRAVQGKQENSSVALLFHSENRGTMLFRNVWLSS